MIWKHFRGVFGVLDRKFVNVTLRFLLRTTSVFRLSVRKIKKYYVLYEIRKVTEVTMIDAMEH